MAKFPQPNNVDASVWRYMDFAKFVCMLSKRQLWMTRADRLGDSHEASTPMGTLNEIQQLIADGVLPAETSQQLSQTRRELSRKLFVSCWHMNEHESETMWHRYCAPTQGVAIKTSYGKLAASVGNNRIGALQIGIVKYLDYAHDSIPLQSSILAPAMHKRIQFSSENEVRIVLLFNREPPPGQEILGTPLDWKPEVIDGIVVHPKSEFWFMEAVNAVIAIYAPSFVHGAQYSSISSSPQF